MTTAPVGELQRGRGCQHSDGSLAVGTRSPGTYACCVLWKGRVDCRYIKNSCRQNRVPGNPLQGHPEGAGERHGEAEGHHGRSRPLDGDVRRSRDGGALRLIAPTSPLVHQTLLVKRRLINRHHRRHQRCSRTTSCRKLTLVDCRPMLLRTYARPLLTRLKRQLMERRCPEGALEETAA